MHLSWAAVHMICNIQVSLPFVVAAFLSNKEGPSRLLYVPLGTVHVWPPLCVIVIAAALFNEFPHTVHSSNTCLHKERQLVH